MTSLGKQGSKQGIAGRLNSYLGGAGTSTAEQARADADEDSAADDAAANWSAAVLSSHPAIASVPFTDVDGKRSR